MESQPDNRTTKSWLYRLRYLKMFKNNSNTTSTVSTDANQITTNPSETTSITFRRSLTTNSLNEITSPDLRKNDTNLRKSLRKWHKRMKNCFSKNSRHLPQRQSIHIVHGTPSPSLSMRSTADGFQNENIYTLDPFTQRLPMSEQSYSNTTSLSPSPSRLTTGTDSQPRSPTFLPASSGTLADPKTPKNEVSSLAHHVWYWGPVSKSLVETKLHGAPDGSFLVRDSASDRHIFSISFRSVGKTLHVRIEHTNNGYRVFDHRGFTTVKELIEEAVRISTEEGLFCYTRSRGDEPNFPVRLLKPISRYDEVRSLQNLSRFVIRQHINVNDIEKLSLPSTLITFLKEESYF